MPFGTDVLYTCEELEGLVLHTEICEDVWTPIPPSTYAALGGATVLANLSASNITIGKARYRRELCAAQSGKCLAAYLYAAAGPGESTTDLAWDGHAMVYELGERVSESERFSKHEDLIYADVDLGRLLQERSRVTSFRDSAGVHAAEVRALRHVRFSLGALPQNLPLRRPVERFPYVPSDAARRDEHCYEAYNIQVQGLSQRMTAAKIDRLVIGVSGGLDSTQALLVAARTMDFLELPRTNILAYTMPGFATSDGTKSNAWKLMRALGTSAEEIDIRPSSEQMLKDIKHPYAEGAEEYDVTFENVQAGEPHQPPLPPGQPPLGHGARDRRPLRTRARVGHLRRRRPHESLQRECVRAEDPHPAPHWVGSQRGPIRGRDERHAPRPYSTPRSVPNSCPRARTRPRPSRARRPRLAPYELQDFNTYYVTRYGFRPSKVAFLSQAAWGDKYPLAEIKKWLEVFCWRFFQISQFKRSAVPNGPKVQSGGSLSPRGDWRMPSDASARVWLEELRAGVPA